MKKINLNIEATQYAQGGDIPWADPTKVKATPGYPQMTQLIDNPTKDISRSEVSLVSQSHKQSAAIKASGVGKTFGAVTALSSIDLTIEAGTVHSLVGANGAGKSTFLGCIAGRIAPSEGTIEIFGEPLHVGDPRNAHNLGIATVFQELTIVPAMSAMENVFLGQSLSKNGFISKQEMRLAFERLCDQFQVTIPWNAQARKLSVADQQMLEIMRCLQSDAKIFLFDEPTTALALPERQALFSVMRQLRNDGKAIVIVSHNLDEVLEISDAITVFRDGRLSRHGPIADWNERSLVEAMLGKYASIGRTVRSLSVSAPDNLIVRNLCVPGVIDDISFDVRKGEIVGIAGLVGSGRTTILRTLAGLGQSNATGKITLNGPTFGLFKSPRAALNHGIALIPEDRKVDGLVLGMNGTDNMIFTDYKQVANLGFLSKLKTKKITHPIVQDFGFDPAKIGTPVKNLSGGNQQKILLSKWNYRTPAVLLIDEPTRGVDVGAKSEILNTLQNLAQDGLSILMVSSELEEIAAICNTIYTVSKGKITQRIDNDRNHVSADDILETLFEV